MEAPPDTAEPIDREVARERVKVLLVGQTPPPVGGQSIMIQKIVEGSYRRVRMYHVRMKFSTDMGEVGRFRVGKLFSLVALIAKILVMRIRHGIEILYFPPSPPQGIPMCRDLAILLSVRWCFPKTVFHFHAGGISEMYDRLPAPVRFLYRWAYYRADAAIRLSALNPPDGSRLFAKREFIVPYGLEDHKAARATPGRKRPERDEILFVAVLRESKGVRIVLDACALLRKRGLDFRLSLMGEYQEESFEREMRETVHEKGLEDHVAFLGRLTGDAKWKAFEEATIFCFPSFFEGEAFPVVNLEAMQFALPIVATYWRGIPLAVDDGKTGHLVPIKDAEAVAERLEWMIRNPEAADEMGRKGRERFLAKFHLDPFYQKLEEVFVSVSDRVTGPLL